MKIKYILAISLIFIQIIYANDLQTCKGICDASASDSELKSCYSNCEKQYSSNNKYSNSQIENELKNYIYQLKQNGQYSNYLTCIDLCRGLYGSTIEYSNIDKYNLCVSICSNIIDEEKNTETKNTENPKSNLNKCQNVNCPEKICKDGILYYDGFCNENTGECNYYKINCDFGCENDEKNCKKAPTAQIDIISISKNEIILNERDQIFIKVKATTKNEKGILIPYPNYEVKDNTYIEISGKNYPLSTFGLEVKNSLKTDKNGEMQITIRSNSKINKEFIKVIEKSKIIVEIANSKKEITMKSPAPKIISIHSSKGHIWQDSYGTIKVIVEDPDNNIKGYNVKSSYGLIRTDKQEDIENEYFYNSNEKNFQFGWKAPKLTQQISIDFAKKFRERFKESAIDFTQQEIDKKMEEYVEKFDNEILKTYAPSSIEEINEVAKGVTELKAIDQVKFAAKYYIAKNPKTKNYVEKYNIFVEAYDSFKEIKDEVKEQASELGEAYEEGGSFFEYASRLGVIAINGYEIHSGVYSLKDDLLKNEDEDFSDRAKKAAKDLTIGSMKDSLKTIADTYKVARAKQITIPYIIKIEVIDSDGYIDTKGYLIEVSGYERIME